MDLVRSLATKNHHNATPSPSCRPLGNGDGNTEDQRRGCKPPCPDALCLFFFSCLLSTTLSVSLGLSSAATPNSCGETSLTPLPPAYGAAIALQSLLDPPSRLPAAIQRHQLVVGSICKLVCVCTEWVCRRNARAPPWQPAMVVPAVFTPLCHHQPPSGGGCGCVLVPSMCFCEVLLIPCKLVFGF